jgi:hypothetical protein
MNPQDEIVDEVRAARETYAARFDDDLERIFEDLKKAENQSPAAISDLKPLEPHKQPR